MNWYIGLSYFSLACCCLSCLYHFIRLISLGYPVDYSQKTGNIGAATRYAFTGAMSPLKKESAYLHLPTYAAGLLYHIGTFISISLFFLFLFKIEIQAWPQWILIGILLLTGFSGLGILIKRLIKKELRFLSNPDDYISNILVTVFHFMTALILYNIPICINKRRLCGVFVRLNQLMTSHNNKNFRTVYHLPPAPNSWGLRLQAVGRIR